MMFPTRANAAIALVGLLMAAGCSSATSAVSTTSSAPATSSSAGPSTVAAPADAAQLIGLTQTALAAATSLTVSGGGGDDDARSTIDLSGALDDSTYRLVMGQGNASVEIIVVEAQLYLKANQAFFAGIGADAEGEQYADRWVTGDSELAAGLSGMSPKTVVDMFVEVLAVESVEPEVTKSTIDGREVFVLTNSEGAESGQAAIAADGSWLPVRFTGPENSSFTFSGWNEPVTLQAPPADQVVTIQ